MNKKVKDFWNKNKNKILAVVGAGMVFAAGVAITVCIKKKSQMNNTPMFKDDIDIIPQDNADRKVLESYGATYEEGCDIPFGTKEVVEKFLDERGSTYQLDILDDNTSVVYIYK